MNTLTLPENGDLHVIPETENKPHIRSRKCWCRPTQEEPGIWLHGEPIDKTRQDLPCLSEPKAPLVTQPPGDNHD